MELTLSFNQEDLLKPTIKQLIENVKKIEEVSKQDNKLVIDLCKPSWVSPLAILPLASLISGIEDKGLEVVVNNKNSYLDTIGFYSGYDSVKQIMNKKNYIPIIRLKNDKSDVKNREEILSCLKEIIIRKINCKNLTATSLYLSFSEIFDNIWEHSQTNFGWLLAQYYKSKNFLDICLVDNGISIKGSYDKAGVSLSDDGAAIKAALGGLSTKKGQSRGSGLPTTKKLITESPFDGNFLILTGSGGYYAEKNKEFLLNLQYPWRGTIALIRIKPKAIDYTKYIV